MQKFLLLGLRRERAAVCAGQLTDELLQLLGKAQELGAHMDAGELRRLANMARALELGLYGKVPAIAATPPGVEILKLQVRQRPGRSLEYLCRHCGINFERDLAQAEKHMRLVHPLADDRRESDDRSKHPFSERDRELLAAEKIRLEPAQPASPPEPIHFQRAGTPQTWCGRNLGDFVEQPRPTLLGVTCPACVNRFNRGAR